METKAFTSATGNLNIMGSRVLGCTLSIALGMTLFTGCGVRGAVVGTAYDQTSEMSDTGYFMRTINDQYSRNSIVCAPTTVGNFIGTVIGSPFFALGALPASGENKFSKTMLFLGMVPVFVVGGALGTPFLPFSYLARKDPCYIKVH